MYFKCFNFPSIENDAISLKHVPADYKTTA